MKLFFRNKYNYSLLLSLFFVNCHPAARQEPAGEDSNDAVEEYIDQEVNDNEIIRKKALIKQKRKNRSTTQKLKSKTIKNRPNTQQTKQEKIKKSKRSVKQSPNNKNNLRARNQPEMVRKDNQNSLRGLKSARAELKNHHQANVSEKIITIPETRAFNRPTLRNLKELYRKTVYGDDYERYKELSNNIQKKIDQLYTTQAGAFTKRGMRNKAKLLLALRKEEKSIKDGIEDTTLALPAGTLIPGKHYRVKTLKMLLAQAKDHTVYTGPYSSLIRKNLGLAPQEELSLIHVNRYIKEHIARQKLMIIKDMRQAQM